jgi:hypothetical protein
MTYELKNVGLWSVAKISFVLGALLGFLIGLLLWMVSGLLQSLPFQELSGEVGLGAAGATLPFILAVLYGVMCMVGNTIMAGIYNVLAGFLGGIDLTLAPMAVAPPPAPAWTPPAAPAPGPPPSEPPPSAA